MSYISFAGKNDNIADGDCLRWRKYYRNSEFHLSYPEKTVSQMVEEACDRHASRIAMDFMGRKISFSQFKRKICDVAAAFGAVGIGAGDRVTVALPNIPQALACFYGLNKIGAVPSMIHPLSAEAEIAFYLEISKSKIIVTLDSFFAKTAEAVKAAEKALGYEIMIIVARVQDELPFPKNVAFGISNRKKIPSIPYGENVLAWNSFVEKSREMSEKDGGCRKKDDFVGRSKNDVAVILYSGGTTGTSKGILLTNLNVNALAMQTLAASGIDDISGLKMLSVMPLFHGFGLGIGIHLPLIYGATCVLLPQFSVKTYAKTLVKKKPNFIPGVPTLFEALLRAEGLEKANLSFLKGVFSGGDSLSVELKKKVDCFLKAHGATVQIREGYGTTECVTACCLTPPDYSREGSIGIPFPDTYFAITEVGGTKHLQPDTEGEICLRGPTVMKGYLDNPEETEQTLRMHEDGNVWLHTGDLGLVDSDGFVYFKQRIKRMIVTSGYNVYPSQLENIIDSHEKVLMSCVIGVPDAYKMQRIKAFVVLRPEFRALTLREQTCETIKQEISAHCRKNIAKYAVPSEIEFRDELPKTLVGKVAYRELEEEERQKAE